MTDLSVAVDDLESFPTRRRPPSPWTSAGVSVDEEIVLYLFGTPGQDRFWFMWDDIASGAVGAVVLVDLRRIGDSFPAIDYFEDRGLPFVVGVNGFAGTDMHDDDAVRDALALQASVPIVRMDARDSSSCSSTLIRLVEHALALAA